MATREIKGAICASGRLGGAPDAAFVRLQPIEVAQDVRVVQLDERIDDIGVHVRAAESRRESPKLMNGCSVFRRAGLSPSHCRRMGSGLASWYGVHTLIG